MSTSKQELEIKDKTLIFPVKTFDMVRKSINRGHQAAIDFANEDKFSYLRSTLLPQLLPDIEIESTFQQSIGDLQDRVRSAILRPGQRKSANANGTAAIRAVRTASKILAETQPNELYSLTRTVEAVTLATLIAKFRRKLEDNEPEARWQSFFRSNPFVIRLAFGLPIAVFGEQVSVGGAGFKNTGGKLADFIIRTGLQGNLGIIEIKKPASVLVEAKPYRGKVHAPSREISGAINQVLDQRYRLQQEITQRKENDNVKDVYAYSVSCLVIVGRDCENIDQKKSFELFRNSQREVVILTFDELLSKLQALHEFLSQDENESEERDNVTPIDEESIDLEE